jgi:3-methylcrotonyl-CoA carboxylase alpha subunit
VTTPGGRTTLVSVAGSAPALWACAHGLTYELDVDASSRVRAGARAAGDAMTPPMPATVVKVIVAAGATVEAGAPVVILEAMKMELTIRATHAGIVRAVRCAVGDLVKPGAVLVEIDP